MKDRFTMIMSGICQRIKRKRIWRKYNYVLISNIGNFTVENDVVCDKMGKEV